MELTYHTDPGRGWVAVPRDVIDQLGVADKVSAYSYESNGMVYLEEDCDAGPVLRLLEERGANVRIAERHTDADHWIRRLPAYRAQVSA